MALASAEREKFLARVPIFSTCSRKELQTIAQAAREVEFQAGQHVVEEGEQGVGFFVITDGKASVSAHGKARASLGAGDFFGEIALLDGGPRTATVIASTPLKVLGLVTWQFRPLLKENPDLTLKILEGVCKRVRALEAAQA